MPFRQAIAKLIRLAVQPADWPSRFLVWRLAAARYRYPFFPSFDRILSRAPSCLTQIRLEIAGRTIALYLDPSDTGDVASLFENFFELPFPPTAFDHIERAVCLGAHIGTFVLVLLAHRPACKVVALEPNPRNYRLLRRNVEINEFDVDIRRAAAWTESGTVTLALGASNAGRVVSEPGVNEPATVTVPALDLCDLGLDWLRQLDFVQIDIEGAEIPVLARILPFLKRGCRIYLELHHSEIHGSELERLVRPRCDVMSLAKIGPHELLMLEVQR